MFGREFKAAEHRRHIPPTQRVGYGVEPVGSRTADRWVLDDLAEMAGLSTRLSNGWEVLQTNGGGPVLFREFNDYDSGKVSPPDSPGGPWNWSVHARLYQVNVGSGAANTADEAMSMVEQTYAEYKRTASRKTSIVAVPAESLQVGDVIETHGETVTIIGGQEPWVDPFGREMFKYMGRVESSGKEGYIMFGPGGTAEKVSSRKTAAPLNSIIFDSFSELLSSAALLPEEQKSVEDAYEAAELGKWEAAYNLIDWVAGGDHGPRIQKFLETLLDDLSRQGATASRTAATYFGKPSSSSQAPLLQRYSKPSKLRGMTFEDLDGLEQFVKAQLEMCPMDSIEVDDVLRGIKAARKWKKKNGYTSSRTAAGKCQKCDGMGRETYETDTGSLSTQTCKACGGTGQAKESRRTASWDQEYDGTWFGSFPNGVLGWLTPSRDSEFPDTYTVSAEIDRPGDSRELFTEFNVSLEEGKRMVEEAAAQVTSSRTANRRTAFLDTVHFAEPRHRVAGWDWDDHLNGFIAAEAAREFTCSCGSNIPAPGYTDCRCGKRWNAYTIQANGSKKMIAREVPVRENVVMARTAHRKTAAGWNKGTHPDISDLSDEQLQDFIDNVQESIDAGANVGEIMRNKRDRFEEELRSRGRKATRKRAASYNLADVQADPSIVQEYDFVFTPTGRHLIEKIEQPDAQGIMRLHTSAGSVLTVRSRTASLRKIAAPSSGADAIAQYFPGWRVDDENGNFWEIHSPGGEHAFIREEDGTYTVLMDDNTPDEFYATGLSFEDALAEVQAEGII